MLLDASEIFGRNGWYSALSILTSYLSTDLEEYQLSLSLRHPSCVADDGGGWISYPKGSFAY